MTVEFAFSLGDRVIVKEIQRPGVVMALRVCNYGKEVLTTYWNDGKRDEVWLYEFELEKRG